MFFSSLIPRWTFLTSYGMVPRTVALKTFPKMPFWTRCYTAGSDTLKLSKNRLQLKKSGFRPIEVEMSGVPSLLHIAVERKKNCQVKALIAQGAHVNERGVGGQTPLFVAVKKRSKEMVSLLLESGANPRQMETSHWNYHYTAFHYAVKLGCYEITRLFIEKAHVSIDMPVLSYDCGRAPALVEFACELSGKKFTPFQLAEREKLMIYILEQQKGIKGCSEKRMLNMLLEHKMERVIDWILEHDCIDFNLIDTETKQQWLTHAKEYRIPNLVRILEPACFCS